MIPLTLADVGKQYTILKLTGAPERRKHLESLGFVAGATVSIISEISGNVIVKVREARIAISKELAQKVMVSSAQKRKKEDQYENTAGC